VHSNGFSLVRKIVFQAAGLTVDSYVPELGTTAGDALLTPTRIYASLLADVLRDPARRSAVSAIAHITGGGLADNIERLLPAGTQAEIDRQTWEPSPVFPWLQRLGNVDREEMYRVFNMGIGLVLCVRPDQLNTIGAVLTERGERWRPMGRIVAGDTAAKYLH
jgi:phosphoribosylformylglycinamidine cyclo-ligase